MNRQISFHSSLALKLSIGIALALFAFSVFGQSKGAITGRVADSSGAVLQGARVQLQPGGITLTTNAWGEFTFINIPQGTYTVTISYVGFEPYSQSVAVGANPIEPINASLNVKSKSEEIIVTAERPHGEAEAINRTRSADNILQVIPADVITSLPNANIADALGRLPSVTLERDEGEGKYVQIRGTEPRLSNVTIDGVNVPSPESGVRQIKLDTVASDLVESIEVNKTLQANQDGDGIGGSVNLKTKTAGDVPALTLYGLGGYTPIIGGRGVDQFGGTIGHRFGEGKKLGILFGGTYDWNGRGINDIEPVPTTSSVVPHYDSMDQRDYVYYRTRWGLTGSLDYKLNEGSGIYLRGLYSTFQNWGHKWVYTLVDGTNPNNVGTSAGLPQASQDWRRPDFAIGSLVLGGKHVFHSSWMSWDLSVARSRSLNGDGGADYTWAGPDISANCGNVPAQDKFRPQFSPACFTPGTGDATDIRNYTLTDFSLPPMGLSAQLNLQGSASFAQQYHVGSHYAIFEFGGKIRNAHKFDDTQRLTADFSSLPPIPAAQFLGTFTDPNYYDKTYHFTNTPDYEKVRAFALASGLITPQGINGNNYNLIERVSAGYLMNTVDLTSRFRLVAGVRFEATHVDTRSFDPQTKTVSIPGGSDYLDVLPSVSLRYGLTKDSGIRAVFSRGISRPDPQDIAQASSTLDTTQTPNVISLGNPNLKAEHSNNYDLLFEQYLNPVGILQAGFFYKQLGDPIVNGQFAESPSLFANQPIPPNSPYVLVSQVQNIGSAHLYGFEIGYSQRLSRLPGVMKGLGLSANYSYTNSTTDGLQGLLRDDHPALLRQAPNTWNISPTYDTNKFSLRVGMTYNDAMIFAYQFQDLEPGTNGIVPKTPAELAQSAAGGVKGPGGDNYLYAHYQLDAQASYKITHSFTIYGYGLNLNNEVFGFYNGSPQYVVQREYYKPTYAGGIRYTFNRER